METRILTIMFTDIVDFADKVGILSRSQVDKFISEQKEIIEPIISEFDGKIVKTVGDSYMVVFTSPTKAVLCGIKVQDEIYKKNKIGEGEFFEIRIGINTGEINVKSRDIFGEPVNIASRVETLSIAGEVFFTESTYLNMNRNEVEIEKVGFKKLKGIKYKVLIYKVFNKRNKNIIQNKKLETPKNFIRKNLFYILFGILFIIFGILIISFFTKDSSIIYDNEIKENKNIVLEDISEERESNNQINKNLNNNKKNKTEEIKIDKEISKTYSVKVNNDIVKFIQNHYNVIELGNYDVAYEDYINKKYDNKKFKEMFMGVKSIILNKPIINFGDNKYNYKLNIISKNGKIENYIVTSKIVKSNGEYKIFSYSSYLVGNIISKKGGEKFIKDHYNNLSDRNFDLVYDNYIKISKNLEEYKKMYGDLDKLEILKIENFFENEYIVKIKLDFTDGTYEIYETILKLRKEESGKIKILSYFSEKI